MELKQKKEELKKYRDFYGGELLGYEDIEKASSEKELYDIIEQHRDHMCSMLSDAYGHLERLAERVKLRGIDVE